MDPATAGVVGLGVALGLVVTVVLGIYQARADARAQESRAGRAELELEHERRVKAEDHARQLEARYKNIVQATRTYLDKWAKVPSSSAGGDANDDNDWEHLRLLLAQTEGLPGRAPTSTTPGDDGRNNDVEEDKEL